MNEIMIKTTDLCKEYRLGEIDRSTFQHELQSWWAGKRGKEDPNSRIGADPDKGGTFLALDHISLEIREGEAFGIIGRNGAGKSTLLKLLSGITAPSSGSIDLYGRTASMLEVGTGFHREMTGRENVYMNGAILGMSRREISEKMDEIIEFSEIGPFIDTPVKRYSSGMYVKLAFSVAVHLNSEILIMDEVLAVGDMMFQRKCLEKMRREAKESGRTVLYVSHNMNTIRQLCDRCAVLDAGKLLYLGDTEEAVSFYTRDNETFRAASEDLSAIPRTSTKWKDSALLLYAEYPGRDSDRFRSDEKVCLKLVWENRCRERSICLRIELWTLDDLPQGSYIIEDLPMGEQGEETAYELLLNTEEIVPGRYKIKYTLFFRDSYGNSVNADSVTGLYYEKQEDTQAALVWDPAHWGSIRLAGAQAKRIK